MYPNFVYDPDFNPIEQTAFVQPVDTNQLTTNWITSLYDQSQLTQDEFLILDFLGVNSLEKSGSLIMSFQGLKRLTELHQARVTKALNRLIAKDYLIKLDSGYKLTLEGMQLFTKLTDNIVKRTSSHRSNLHYTVGTGIIQGPILLPFQRKKISEGLVGKWFGAYRFVTKIDFDNSFEICWISTNTSITATLKIGEKNSLILAVSAPLPSLALEEIHLISDHLSRLLEQIVDAPVIFNSFKVYESNGKENLEVEDAKLKFAG